MSAVTADHYYKVSLRGDPGPPYKGIAVEERPWSRKPYYGVFGATHGEFTTIDMRGDTAYVHGRCLDDKSKRYRETIEIMGPVLRIVVVDDGCPAPPALGAR